MAGKRKNNPLDLPDRVYHKHGAFYYQHPKSLGGKLERLGTDIKEAKRKADLYNDSQSKFGTFSYWMDKFLVSVEKRIGKSKAERGISQRTYNDYKDNSTYLKSAFGHMDVTEIKPFHVGKYLEIMREKKRAVRANREKACLSACYTWLMLQQESGVTLNPCIGVKRNPEKRKTRYVSDEEVAVLMEVLKNVIPQSKRAAKNVKALLMLIYATLQRPEDILGWSDVNLEVLNGKVVIHTKPGKTEGRTDEVIYIEVTPSIKLILTELGIDVDAVVAAPARLSMPLIHTNKGKEYTYDGISAIMKRYRAKAQKLMPKMKPWGFYDMKAKGASDMREDGVQTELIQFLCGHASITTTEIYLKGRKVGVTTPNARVLA